MHCKSADEARKVIEKEKFCQFDCKCWTVPTENDVFAWFLWRNLDCIKNSKQQAAQTYISHKQLNGKTADEGIDILKSNCKIDWNEFPDSMKYGRIIYKKEMELIWNNIPYTRKRFVIEPGFPLCEDGNKEKFLKFLGLNE